MESYKYELVCISCWVFFWIISLDTIISHSFVEGKQIIRKNYLGLKRKGTIKTIMIPEYGEVVDCVDFYKQPAFDDPLIRALPVDSDLYPPKMKIRNHDHGLDQMLKNWYKYGGCPNGTIAITRTYNRNIYKKKGHPLYSMNGDHEYAVVKQPVAIYYGMRANISLWNPKVAGDNEISLAQIWLESGVKTFWKEMNTIEAGWIVHPSWKYKDNRTRFFVYWTRDNYDKTGCYNLACAGFIQTYQAPIFQLPLEPISQYNETEQIFELGIYKNNRSGNWVLQINEVDIGYWPYQLFTSLASKAECMTWGGEITNHNRRHHTSTQMGSGHFPSEGFKKSGSFSKLMFMSPTNTWVQVESSKLNKKITREECYDLSVHKSSDIYGTYFFYGGPGYSERCK